MGTKPDTTRLDELNQRLATTAVLIQAELERMFPCGSMVDVYLNSRRKTATRARVITCPFAHHFSGSIQVEFVKHSVYSITPTKRRIHYTKMEIVQPCLTMN